jgi:hypothetical protein
MDVQNITQMHMSKLTSREKNVAVPIIKYLYPQNYKGSLIDWLIDWLIESRASFMSTKYVTSRSRFNCHKNIKIGGDGSLPIIKEYPCEIWIFVIYISSVN